ncbi:MAG: T9SS type A sorting domain-containing protein [Bacteroidota bacterium]
MKKILLIIITIVTNVSLIAQPANDNCAGAISLTVNTTCTPVTGDVSGASQSLPANTTCSTASSANDDVWYWFVATNQFMNVTVVGSNGFDPVFEVYSISCGGTSLGCTNANSTFGGTETVCLSGLITGSAYWVRIYDSGTGIPTTTTFTICITTCTPTGINETVVKEDVINIFPNPSNGKFNISSTKNNIESIKIINLLGEQVFSLYNKQNQTENTTIDLSRETKGIYFVRIEDENKNTIDKKIVLQ